jgi:hypothetical protein
MCIEKDMKDKELIYAHTCKLLIYQIIDLIERKIRTAVLFSLSLARFCRFSYNTVDVFIDFIPFLMTFGDYHPIIFKSLYDT